jgi:hypothetical protein
VAVGATVASFRLQVRKSPPGGGGAQDTRPRAGRGAVRSVSYDMARQELGRDATASISTLAPSGSAATWKVERAGGDSGKKRA